MLLDSTGRGQRRGARWLMGIGVLLALPAIASGLSDWSDTDLAETRVGLVHAALNTTAVGCFTMSWWARRRGGRAGQCWSLLGATVATGAGWLGGHLAYNMGVGVDTNAFEVGPADWTKVSGKIDPNGGVSGGIVDGVRVVAVQTGGTARVLAGRCCHRGGPLHEGHRRGTVSSAPGTAASSTSIRACRPEGRRRSPNRSTRPGSRTGISRCGAGSLGPCASAPYAPAEATELRPVHSPSCPCSSERRDGSMPTGVGASTRRAWPRPVGSSTTRTGSGRWR